MRCVIMIFLIALSEVNGLAQNAWTKEPTSFLGVKFGQPLSASYPECAHKVAPAKTIYQPDGSATCWEPYGHDAVLVRAGEFFKIYVQSVNGNVASISASFKHSDFDKIAKELIAKYGEPQWRNHPPVPTKDGPNLPSDGLNWFGKDVNLFCSSQSPIKDEGLLGMENRAWREVLERDSRY